MVHKDVKNQSQRRPIFRGTSKLISEYISVDESMLSDNKLSKDLKLNFAEKSSLSLSAI